MEITINKCEWKSNEEWIKKNPTGRLIALFYPKRRHITLVRSSNPYEYFTSGYEIEYPDYLDKTLSIPEFMNEDGVVLNLKWI